MSQPYFYKYGEKGSGFRAPNASAVQDYDEIKQKCLRSGQPFEDPVFPAIASSIYYSTKRGAEFKWMRPSELVDNPEFISDGASRFDVMQGELGDCWLLAAIANLTMNSKLFQRVVPPDQILSGSGYSGVLHFRFWRYGKWIDIVIDDRLPTLNGRLVFMHSKDKREFWSALAEKAYAKLHGSYEALKGGSTCEALEDFTGGLTEYYDLQTEECPPNLFQIMQKAAERSSFMGCSIDALSSAQMEAELENGLIRGHAYSITAVKTVELKTARVQGKIPLLRIRNPWGNEAEWKGAWSDKSREWSVISEDEKHELQLTFDSDGEFWMSFQDFKNNYTKLEICNLSPEPLEEGVDSGKQWQAHIFDGSWISGVTAGGCRNHLETFAMNPQYLVKLTDFDEGDNDDQCTLIVALMQKNRRAKRKMGADALTIGFAVYHVKDGHFEPTDEPVYVTKFKKQLLTTEYFKYNASVARSPNFINLREVCARFRLPPGNYCIIPSTFDPNEEGEFLLRFFAEKPPGMVEENDDEVGIVETPQKANGVVDNVVPEPNEKEKQKEKEHDTAKEELIPKPGDASNEATANTNKIADLLKLFATCWSSFHQPDAQEPEKIKDGKPVVDNHHQEFFAKIAGEDMEVDALELQQILNYALKKDFKFDGFSLDSCRSMVALLDDDKSGMLGIDEFTELWRSIRHWCSVFRKFDTDNSNTLSAKELRAALQEAGLSVNRNILVQIIQRYGVITSGKKGEIKVERGLSFDAFVCCCIKLKHSIDVWNQHNQKRSPPSFSLDEWVENVMYC